MALIDKVRKRFNRNTPLRRGVKLAAQPLLAYLNARSVRRYHVWLRAHMLTKETLDAQNREAKTLPYRPLFSIVVPVYSPSKRYFEAMLESVIRQTYDNWELILVDDASPDNSTRQIIERYAGIDKRITYIFLESNRHIAGATNAGIKRARGEFISLLDNDDILEPAALFEVATALNANRTFDLIYTDEDKLVGTSPEKRISPYFKPGFNQDFLYSVNYITHFSTIRRVLLEKVGMLSGEYNGAQDWELFLRIARATTADKIHHIPKILYSWRVHESSTAGSIEKAKPYVTQAQRKAVELDLIERGYTDYSLQQDELYPAQWVLRLPVRNTPVITVVSMGLECDINGIKSVYANSEILQYDASRSINQLSGSCKGDYVLFVYESVDRWNSAIIENLISDAQRKDIGFVVAKYLNDDDIMQNIKALISSDAVKLVETMDMRDLTKHLYSTVKYNIPYVPEKACIMVETKKLREVASHSPNESTSLREWSQRLSAQSYRTLYNPYAEML